MAISLILVSMRKVTSTSTLLMLLMCVEWMLMLVRGGIKKLPIVGLGIFVSSFSGRRCAHLG